MSTQASLSKDILDGRSVERLGITQATLLHGCLPGGSQRAGTRHREVSRGWCRTGSDAARRRAVTT